MGAAGAAPVGAQEAEPVRVVLSRPLTVPTREALRVDTRRAVTLPRGDSAGTRLSATFLARLVGFSHDSLILEVPGRREATERRVRVAVADVARASVQTFNDRRARLDAAGETAFYTGILGALAGGVVAALSPVTKGRGIGLGAGAGLVVGFVAGLGSRSSTAGIRWEPVEFRVER